MLEKIKNELRMCESLLESYKYDLQRSKNTGNEWGVGYYEGHVKSYEFIIERLEKLIGKKMTNLQIYISALQKTWWLWLPIILAILGTGFHEAIETKWERRNIK